MFEDARNHKPQMPVSVTDMFHANNLPITFAITVAAISTEHFYETHTSPHVPQQMHHPSKLPFAVILQSHW
jgi:hypothetical protein